MTVLSRCALIATIAAASIAPPAFAQSKASVDGGGYYDVYGAAPGAEYRWHAPALTGGGSLGHNIMTHIH